MNFISFAAKNLARHRTRTALTVLGVGIAAATLFSILSFDVGYRKALQEELAGSGVHLFVSTEGCPLEAASLILHGGEIPKFLTMQRLEQTRAVEGVKNAAGFLIFSIPSPDGSRVDMFYGVTDDARKLKPAWKVRGNWFQGEDSILLGTEVAKVNKRDVGDKIYIESLDREFMVSGILEKTYGQDDGFFFLPLSTAQKLFKKEGKLTAVGVQLADISRMQSVKDKLEALPDVYVVPAEQMSQEILQFIGGTKALMYAVLLIALVVSALGVLNTVLMATFERQKEFGFLRCVGAGKADMIRIILLETLVVCLAGGLLGVAAGFAFSSVVEHWMRQFLPYVPAGRLLRPDTTLAALSIGATLVLGAMAGLYPGIRASGVSPIEAIHNE